MTKTAEHEKWILEQRPRYVFVTVCMALLFMAASTAQGQTYTFSVLYTFTGTPDGASPAAGLALDGRGNLYGTTSHASK
jgi:hypothetical protein